MNKLKKEKVNVNIMKMLYLLEGKMLEIIKMIVVFQVITLIIGSVIVLVIQGEKKQRNAEINKGVIILAWICLGIGCIFAISPIIYLSH